MQHLILLGDSIFDNARYTAGGAAVIRQVSAPIPFGWRASLLAADGSIARHVLSQLT